MATLSAYAAPAINQLPDTAAPFAAPAEQTLEASTTFAVSLPGGSRVAFHIRHTELRGGIGIQGQSSNGDRLLMHVAGQRVVSGDIYTDGGHFRVADHAGRYYWIQDSGQLDLHEHTVPLPLHDVQTPATGGAIVPAERAEPGADGVYEIDVLALYTPAYAERYGSHAGVASEAERLIFLANAYFENSYIPVRYRFVGAHRYTRTSESDSFYPNLEAMATDRKLAQLRDATGADLAILLRTLDGAADLCGLSAGFNNGERSDPPTNVVPDRDGLAVAGMGADSEGYRCADVVFAHELAHNLAAGHDFRSAPGPYYWKSYAHGWTCGNGGIAPVAQADTYGSIMYAGYRNEVNAQDQVRLGVIRSDFFSSPNLSVDGQPCGLAGPEGSEAGEADNARVITEAAPYVAAYRQSRSAARAASVVPATPAGGALGISLLLTILLVIGRRAGVQRKG